MASQRTYRILLAEDEQFQRLALFDLLELCDYEVTTAEDGKRALAELRDENREFDLVLLDLYMPEMDGFELLTLMQNDERLSLIPVVVMSADGDKDIIANCLRNGAKDYLVKPVRFQECKGLVRHMSVTNPSSDKSEKGLHKYEKIRYVDGGATGQIDLVRSKHDGEQYALKQIKLMYLTEKDRQNVENEILLLKALQGPTLIKFVESFNDKDCKFIVMEYADGGNLAQKILKRQQSGQKFNYDEILRYIAQITLALMAMHQKNILHRDIKTQNIFITKGDILKLGDFGISKQMDTKSAMGQTSCGTPYYMSPEVCASQPYDSKADVWALGVILYEFITFKKPFDADKIQDLFEKIQKEPYPPLPDDIHSNLKMLVSLLLHKEYSKRPNIFELSKIPCVNKAIRKFVEETNCQQEVLNIFDMESGKNQINQSTDDQKQDKDQGVDQSSQEEEKLGNFQMEQLEEIAELIRNDIHIQDYKNGWFSKHLRCAQGRDIYRWVLEHVESNEKKCRSICQVMLDKDIIQSVENRSDFEITGLYRMYMDRDDIPDNMVRRYKDKPRPALEVSQSLVGKAEDLFAQAIKEEDGVTTIDVEAALKSQQYQGYLNAVSELEKVNVNELDNQERIAFFLNVYQCMYIHHFLKMTNEGRGVDGNGQSTGASNSIFSFASKIKSIVWDYSIKQFYYRIGGFDFSLDQIKHGLLRGNKKSPHAYLRSTLDNHDPRAHLIKELNDPRINFVCLDFPEVIEHIDRFNAKDLDLQLEAYVAEIVNSRVVVNTVQGELTLPRCLQTYYHEFTNNTNKDEDLLKFVFRYYTAGEISEDKAVRDICYRKSMMIRYD